MGTRTQATCRTFSPTGRAIVPAMLRRSRSQILTVPAVGRWVLTLLTLLAALAHLTRSPAAGGLGLTLPGLTTAAPPHATPSATADHADHAPVTHEGMSDMADLPVTETHAGHEAGPRLTDAAPNAPPSHEHHSDAHCPFCLTAGFALEVTPVTPVTITIQALSQPTNVPLTLALAVVRHADPRAPPTS